MEGTIARLQQARGFGFLTTPGNPRDIFFHCRDVDQSLLPWDASTLTGRRVLFDLVTTDKGLAAKNVRAVS